MNFSCSKKLLRIGDVYLMRFDGSENEQRGWRPGVVFQNNIGNRYSPNIIALPLTTAIKKLGQPTHVLIKADDSGLKRDSIVICENPERMSKKRVGKFITSLSDEYVAKIAEANLLSSSAIAYIQPETLLNIWRQALRMNGREVCYV